MPTVMNDFDTYQVTYRSHPRMADISCWQGARLVGNMRFEDVTPPRNSVGANNMINLFFGLSQFHDVYTIVREEKPLYIWLDTTTNWGSVSTRPYEPVGEDEGP